NMGKFHADYLLAGKVSRGELTAVCSSSPAKLGAYKALRIFDDAQKLIGSGAVMQSSSPRPIRSTRLKPSPRCRRVCT
ncbi:MAG TPA: hypothetical protein VEO53_16285, partial [Candidatus Binatia bacterium]|nr:hypothetical protein [Candidatus Binatia bacterium]